MLAKQILAVIALTLGAQFSVAAIGDIATCDEAKALNELDSVGAEYRDKIRIPSVMSMMSDYYRTPIRKYYQAASQCPTRAVVRKYIVELQTIGYPNEYLEGILSALGTGHGLKVYELGDTWNRELVTEEILAQDSLTKKIHDNIAIMGLPKQRETGLTLYSVGTGSKIGAIGNKIYVATALHVLRDNAESIKLEETCQRFIFHFPALGKRHFNGTRLLVSNSKTDFAICEVELPSDIVAESTLQVSTSTLLEKNTPLITMGYNIHNKVPTKAHVERSSDCRLFFDSSQTRLLEEVNPSYSLPTACDVAPGDSGSPVLNKNTGELIGFMTQTTKVKSGATSAELTAMQNDGANQNALWSELSMISPITKIREVICAESNDEIVHTVLKCQ